MSILLDLAEQKKHIERRAPGSNYAIIDATRVGPVELVEPLTATAPAEMLAAAEMAWLTAEELGRLTPPLYGLASRGMDGAVMLALASPEAIGRRASDRAMLVATRFLLDAFHDRPQGVRVVLYGRDELVMHEAGELERGMLAIDIKGRRDGASAEFAPAPEELAGHVLRLLLAPVLYGCVMAPDAELPGEKLHAWTQFSRSSVGVHAAAETVDAWTAYLRQHCDRQAVVVAYLTPAPVAAEGVQNG